MEKRYYWFTSMTNRAGYNVPGPIFESIHVHPEMVRQSKIIPKVFKLHGPFEDLIEASEACLRIYQMAIKSEFFISPVKRAAFSLS